MIFFFSRLSAKKFLATSYAAGLGEDATMPFCGATKAYRDRELDY